MLLAVSFFPLLKSLCKRTALQTRWQIAQHRPVWQDSNQPGVLSVGYQLAGCALQASKKRRLDEVCAERFPQHSRNVVQSWIAQGKVSVNARVVLKAGAPVAPDASIIITADVPKFVCRCRPRLPFVHQKPCMLWWRLLVIRASFAFSEQHDLHGELRLPQGMRHADQHMLISTPPGSVMMMQGLEWHRGTHIWHVTAFQAYLREARRPPSDHCRAPLCKRACRAGLELEWC